MHYTKNSETRSRGNEGKNDRTEENKKHSQKKRVSLVSVLMRGARTRIGARMGTTLCAQIGGGQDVSALRPGRPLSPCPPPGGKQRIKIGMSPKGTF